MLHRQQLAHTDCDHAHTQSVPAAQAGTRTGVVTNALGGATNVIGTFGLEFALRFAVATNFSLTGRVEVIDAQSTNVPNRFYRARETNMNLLIGP